MALELIAKGMKPGKAMLEAGYSKSASSAPTRSLLSKPSVQSVVDKMQIAVLGKGITVSYLAGKFAEWLESTSTDRDGTPTPNHDIQMKAYDRIKDILGIAPAPNDLKGIKRKMTIEEYISKEDNTEDIQDISGEE